MAHQGVCNFKPLQPYNEISVVITSGYPPSFHALKDTLINFNSGNDAFLINTK